MNAKTEQDELLAADLGVLARWVLDADRYGYRGDGASLQRIHDRLSAPPEKAKEAGGMDETTGQIAALARGYELMFRALCHIAGTSGESCHWYSHKAQAVTAQVVPLWKLDGESNKSRPGDCLTQAAKFLSALAAASSSIPAPEKEATNV